MRSLNSHRYSTLREQPEQLAGHQQPTQRRAVAARQPGSSVITSDELLSKGRELTIVHQGEHYLLRVTSKGRLILTK